MSSTNVHSNKEQHICCGQTIATEESDTITIPPKASGRGPSIIEIIEGDKIEINAQSNLVIKDKNKTVGRVTTDGKVLTGDKKAVEKALKDKDMEK